MFLEKNVRSLKGTGHWAGAGNCAFMLLAPHKMESTHWLQWELNVEKENRSRKRGQTDTYKGAYFELEMKVSHPSLKVKSKDVQKVICSSTWAVLCLWEFVSACVFAYLDSQGPGLPRNVTAAYSNTWLYWHYANTGFYSTAIVINVHKKQYITITLCVCIFVYKWHFLNENWQWQHYMLHIVFKLD